MSWNTDIHMDENMWLHPVLAFYPLLLKNTH